MISYREKIDELEDVVSASTEVNKHLALQIERLCSENETLKHHIARLRAVVKPSATDNSAAFATAGETAAHEPDDEPLSPALYSTKDWDRLRAHAQSHGWLVEPHQVHLGPILGEGSFGAIHRAVWRGAECAVKVVRVADGNAEAFAREATALSSVRHPNVVQLYGAVIQPPERCWIVTELLPGGTLAAWLHGPPGSRRPPQRTLLERLKMALDVACGCEALEQHEPPIMHRDLKPSNVLLDAAGRAKVADMGLARVLTPDALVSLTPETGSYLYMAPEVIRHEMYATQADVWSWACLTCELLTGAKPYEERYLTPVQVALKVADDGMHPLIPEPPACPKTLGDLLKAALDPEPLNRPSFAVAAAVLAEVIQMETAKSSTEAAAAGGVMAAWGKWMKPS